jgi:hypothetical protein
VDLRAHERRRRFRRLDELAERLDLVSQKTGGLAEAACVVDAAGRWK